MSEDKEAAAIVKVISALADLDEDARGRVLRWANERYASSKSSTKRHEQRSASDEHEDLATLFSEATPKTDAERVLVASYWFQEIQGNKDLPAQTINAALKHLGEGVGNVTVAFRSLIEEKPALAMQVQKSGKTQQARKKYRLTTPGLKRVEQMLRKGTE